MAETGSTGDSTLSTGGISAGPAGVAVPAPARLPGHFVPTPVTPGVAIGLPIVEVPALVEPIGFDDPPAEIRPPEPTRRPIRRRFLPPAPQPTANRYDEQARNIRTRLPPPAAAPLEIESAGWSTSAPPRLPPAVENATLAEPPWRRWLRPLLAGGGVAVALALAIAVEVGGSVDWPDQLGTLLPQRSARTAVAANAAVPSAEAAQRAAEYSDRARAGNTEAQLALAILYAKGDGVAQDYATAATWFRRAAEKGLMRAQYDLGVLYERGRGVPLDPAQAVVWYRKAAEQNHPLAEYNLAVAYTKGEGIRRDPFEAAVWYHRAAAQGVVAAMINLAILYERGDGVDASTIDSYAWYRAAAKRGSAPASRRADELLQAFTSWDQTRAEAKMTDIAASIRDAVGERARARGAPAAASGDPGPILKSGIENGRSSPAAVTTATVNP